MLAQGCKKDSAQTKQTDLKAERKKPESPKVEEEEEVKERGGNRQVTVFLDGKPTAALRYGELPLSVGPVMVSYGIPEDNGKRPRRRCFRLAEYIEGLGLDISKLNTIMLAAGRASRISHLTSKALLKHRDDMYFAFTGDTKGGVYMRYSPDIESNDVIDKLRVMYLYEKKKGPVWDKKKRIYKYKGKKMEEIPHYEGPMEKGTRLYFGDRIHSVLKKRVLAGGSGAGKGKATHGGQKATRRMALKDYLVREALELDKIKRIDIIDDDEIVKSFKSSELDKIKLVAKPKSGGRIIVEPSSSRAQAIILRTEVRERPKPRYAEGPPP